jgi:hypothetical protein
VNKYINCRAAVDSATSPDIKTVNDFEEEPVNTEKKPALKARGKNISYNFPSHSFTMLKGKINH